MRPENIKIAFFDTKEYDKQSFNTVNEKYNFKIKYFKNHLTIDTVQLTKGYDVVCIFVNDIIDQEIVNALIDNGVQLLALRSAGYNNVDLKAVYKNIHTVRVPSYSPYAVAEHTVALALALNRKIYRAYYRTRDGNFNINGLLGFDMYKKTAGVIGTGQIGKILIDILKGFNMNIVAYDKFPDTEYAKARGFTYADLDTLYAKSDIISLNCPLNKETHHMINSESLAKMKKKALVINTGRGHLINTADLVEVLKEGEIGGAGLDVYEEETEYFFEDFSNQIISDDVLARLLTFPNVLVTSHQAFFTEEALYNIADTTLFNIKEFSEDKDLTNEICYRCKSNVCNKETEGRCF